MPWMAFGNRGPGGSRTGSVVAVAMSSPLHAGATNYLWRRNLATATYASGYRVVAQRKSVLFLHGVTHRRRPEKRCFPRAVEPIRPRCRAVAEVEHRVIEQM